MITDYNISNISQDDIPDMRRILKTASRDWNVNALASCFGSSYKHWGIFFKGAILGFVIIKKVLNNWELMQIVTDKDYQSQGLARRLLQFVVVEARKEKVKKIQLEVRRSNAVAIRLYYTTGFREVGVRKKYYSDSEDAVLMDLVL